MNNYPENQHSYGRKSSASESKFSKRKKQIVIFSDSIPRGIRLREFNYWLHKGYAQLKSFPGGTFKELLYFVEPTLENKKFDAALLYVGVNDLLNDESQDSVQNLLDNLKQAGLKRKSAGVKLLIPQVQTSAFLIYAETTHMCSLTTITFPHQVSFAMVDTYLKSENVF